MESTGRTAAPASLEEAQDVDRAARETASHLVRRRPAAVTAR
jgi:hypothetical protein